MSGAFSKLFGRASAKDAPVAAVKPVAAAEPAATAQKPRQKAKRAAPFCIRLTAEERAYLEELAGDEPLGGYIRRELLGNRATRRRKLRKPRIEDEQYASMLGEKPRPAPAQGRKRACGGA